MPRNIRVYGGGDKGGNGGSPGVLKWVFQKPNIRYKKVQIFS